jgi:hypothetical protein
MTMKTYHPLHTPLFRLSGLMIGLSLGLRSLISGAAETNRFFVIDDGWPITESKIEAAKTNKLSRPAADDPEGNWGAVRAGIQVSLRFSKEAFGKNESPTATVILRNVSGEEIQYPGSGTADDVVIEVTDGNGQRLPVRAEWLWRRRFLGGPQILQGGTQRVLMIKLTDRFQLGGEGTFSAVATIRVVAKNGNLVEVTSGSAKFKIQEPEAAAKQAGTSYPP